MPQKEKLVLLGVVNRKKDLNIALNQHWYRIPSRYAPKKTADFLALYQTSVFKKDGKSIKYYAPIKGSTPIKRYKLLPEEKNHPRTDEFYQKLHLGSPKLIPQRIENRSRRRISFGFTTLTKMLNAREVSELFDIPPIEEIMKNALILHGINASHEHSVMKNGRCRYRLDFAIFCRRGKIDIECDNEKWHSRSQSKKKDRLRNRWLKNHGWTVLRFSGKMIKEDINGCIKIAKKSINNLGGQS